MPKKKTAWLTVVPQVEKTYVSNKQRKSMLSNFTINYNLMAPSVVEDVEIDKTGSEPTKSPPADSSIYY